MLGASLTGRCYKTVPDSSPWVSILETITASGKRLSPVVTYTGSIPQAQWFPPELPRWKYDYSLTGCTNNNIALCWLREVYLPEAAPENDREWRLLITDQHSTHVGVDFTYEA